MNNKRCVKCGSEEELTKDHIIPKWIYKRSQYLGFKKNLGKKNEQILCSKCNSKKAGGIDVTTEIGRNFWIAVRDLINKELEK